MIHARISNDHTRSACGPWIEADGVVTNSEQLIDCPLCMALLPLVKQVLEAEIANLTEKVHHDCSE